jgi:adenylate cyclase, class 2
MPVNLELKIKLLNAAGTLKKLNELKAEFKGVLNQTDIYYKYKNGLLKLRIEDGTQTLIKYIRNEGSGERWSDFQLLSLEGNDAGEYLRDILTRETIVEKKRKLYLYDNTRIHIDDVKILGSFLELETLVVNGEEDAEKRFNSIKEMLSLNGLPEIRKSYRDIMLAENKN